MQKDTKLFMLIMKDRWLLLQQDYILLMRFLKI